MIIGKARYGVKVGETVIVRFYNKPNWCHESIVTGEVTKIRVGQIDLKVGTKNGRDNIETVSIDNIEYLVPNGQDLLEKQIVSDILISKLGSKNKKLIFAVDKFLLLGINIAYCSAKEKGFVLDCNGKIVCTIEGDGSYIKAKIDFVNNKYRKVWGISRDNEFSPEQVQLFEDVLNNIDGNKKIDKIYVEYLNGIIVKYQLKLY